MMICNRCNEDSPFLNMDFESSTCVCDNCYKEISKKPCINIRFKDNQEMRLECFNKQKIYTSLEDDSYCYKCIKGESLDQFYN